MVIFHKMGAHPIRLWDESYFAVHSYEMLQRGSWLGAWFDGQLDMRGSKPPLQNWLQMAFISLVGMSEVAVRLPSALAAGASVVVLFMFLKQRYSPQFAWVGALVLLCSVGFVNFHAARTGDADALVSMFMLLQVLCYFVWTTKPDQMRWLWLGAAATILGFWSKGIVAGFFVPGLLIHALAFHSDKLKVLGRQPRFYGLLVTTLVGCISFFALKEWAQPGYLEYFSRVHAGRFVNAIGPHENPWHYYLLNLIRERYTWWLIPLAFAMVMVLVRHCKDDLMRLSSIVTASFFALLSLAKSKLYWYDTPIYPIMAMLVAWSVVQLLSAKSLTPSLQAAVVVALFVLPIWEMQRRADANWPGLANHEYEIKEFFLHKMAHRGEDPNGLVVIQDMFPGGLLFYKHLFEHRSQRLEIRSEINDLEGRSVLTSDKNIQEQLNNTYHLDTAVALRNAMVFDIHSIRR